MLDATGSPRDVTTDRVRAGAADVSPDGQWLAYNAFDERGRPAIVVCDLAACSSKRTLPPMSRWRWMPDSRALVFAGQGRASDLWVQPLDGGRARQFTRFASDGREIADFAWSADGRRLAVARALSSSNIVLFRGFRGAADR